MKLPPLEQKIVMNIKAGVICADMVDFYKSSAKKIPHP